MILPLVKENVLLDGIGYVALTEVMGDDRTPARTARTSFRNAAKERSEEQDNRLTSYLVKHNHSTPLEFVQVRFYVKQPITVARQLVRQRTQAINEVSYRYVTASREFYVPPHHRMQKKSETNKQGSAEEVVDNPELCAYIMRESCNASFDAYDKLLAADLAPELARSVLPVSTYTEWYAQMSIWNFLNSVARLRTTEYAPHAQWETKQYADAMLSLTEQTFPVIVGAWREKMKTQETT